MDLFISLCGCLLAVFLPSAVRAEEGGEFDTSLRAQTTLSHPKAACKLTRFVFLDKWFPIHITSTEPVTHVVWFRLQTVVVFPRRIKLCCASLGRNAGAEFNL